MTATRLLAGLLLLPSLLPAQQAINRKYAVDPEVSIRVYVPSGSVVITGWDRDTIAVAGKISSGGGTFFGGGGGRAAKLGVEGDESGAGPGADLRIQVPRRARLWIKTATATVEVRDTDGELDVLSVNGSVTVVGQPKIASLESIDGSIRIEAGSPVLRARTSGGAVTVLATSGDLTVETVSGAVDVSVAALGRGRLETVSGPITFRGNLGSGAELDTETHSAAITLSFAGPVNAEFQLASPGGGVVNKLADGPKAAKGKPTVLFVGTPSAVVTARSLKGTITVTR